MASPSDYNTEVFRLSLAAGFYHPDPDARRSIRTLLDKWLEKLKPSNDENEIEAIISHEKGTAIEPFVITAEDLECSIFLARAAFSELGGQTRFRIVSRETIGRQGGLVMTNNLRSFYSERYVKGKHCHQQQTGWAFIPSAISSTRAELPNLVDVKISSEHEGFRILAPIPECRNDPALFARKLQKNSFIEGVSDSISSLGLRIECHDGKVHVMTGSPESMIRMMAHMTRNSTLVLKGEDSDQNMPVTLIRLGLPEDDPLQTRALIGSTSNYVAWMIGHITLPLELEEKHKLIISSSVRPHREWIEKVFTTLL